MADKKFTSPSGVITSPELSADYNQATVFDKIRVGDLGVYYVDGLKTRYIPYDCAERVFIRLQEVRGKLCCGMTTFLYSRLVFVSGGKEILCLPTENEKAMDDALALIAQKAPGLAIGVEETA